MLVNFIKKINKNNKHLTLFFIFLFLTIIPFLIFFIDIKNVFFIKTVIFFTAFIQIFLHCIFFLHLNLKNKNKIIEMSLFLFTITIVLIILVGSLWIMNDLNHYNK